MAPKLYNSYTEGLSKSAMVDTLVLVSAMVDSKFRNLLVESKTLGFIFVALVLFHSFQPFKPPTQMTRNTQQVGNKSILPKPTPMDWSSYSGLSRYTVQPNRHPAPTNNQPQFKVEELFYQEDPYQDEAAALDYNYYYPEAAALDYNYYYPEEYTYEIPQTEENTNDPSPEHVEEAENFRITASETTAENRNLEEFDYEIVYKKGTQNTNADALSRIELNPVETESMIVNIDDEQLEELLHTDENIRLSAEEIENIINDLEGENDLLDTINSNIQ
ncbi:hypothetical protein QE152_g4802 [Popillia japonica]|uniref:Uncharacterized protein n=1 Tax=Popillia japonica TaxID=7064 RepID=A0AAW1MS70_POPJA